MAAVQCSNRPDPLFWTPNYQAYADLDPNEVGVVTVNPSVDGARGWQVSGMGGSVLFLKL